MKPITSLLFSVLACVVASSTARAGTPDQDLQTAYANLVIGREYLRTFPERKSRAMLIQDYLNATTNGAFVTSPKFDSLAAAVDLAVNVRTRPDSSSMNLSHARTIAWEALEAALTGQLFAGNSDLLNALRVAFPVASPGGDKPPGSVRPMPLGTPAKDLAGNEYSGANIKNLGYARLHFFRGVSLLLDFLVTDPTAEIPVVDNLTYPQAPTYTVFNNTNTLPYPLFTETNFLTVAKPTQTAAYLYGNILNRFGLANLAMADRLWRAAFFGTGGAAVRDEMLNKATAELRRTVHAQFLATLPLAATLNDGNATDEFGNPTENDYQTVRLNQVGPSVAAAINLMERINRREAPKLDSLNLNVSDASVQNQIGDVVAALQALESAHALAKAEVDKLNTAGQLQASDALNIRSSYETQMLLICGLDPAAAPYNGLTDAALRRKYREDVEATFDARMKAGLESIDLVDGTDIGKAALAVLRAFNDIEAGRVEVDSIPLLIEIEEDRNREANTIVRLAGQELEANIISRGVYEAWPKPIIGFPHSSVQFNPGAIGLALLQAEAELIGVEKEVDLNNNSSRARVRELLVRQRELLIRLPSVVAQARLAIAEMNSLHKRLLRLIDDHVFFQQNTADLWYYDPSVLFEQTKAEMEYQTKLADATIKLYLLARKLDSRWTEPYQNPPRNALGLPGPALGNQGQYDDFTEPESAFVIADNTMANNFYDALKAWHDYMRSQRPSPATTPSLLTTEVSIRQDLLGLGDFLWNPNTATFEVSPSSRERNIAIFRAYLLRAQEHVVHPGHVLEMEIGINTFAPKRSTASSPQGSSYLIPRGNGYWNHRLNGVSAIIEGSNVRQTLDVPITFYQYGKCYTVGFFDGYDTAHVDNLALYFRDPRSLPVGVNWEGVHHFIVNAKGDQTPDVTQVADLSMSPYCDRYLMAIESGLLQGIPVNVQNISDIKLTLNWTIGSPPAYTW